MNTYESYAGALRSVGHVAREVGKLGYPSVTIKDDWVSETVIGEPRIEIPENTFYWDTLDMIRSIVDEYFDDYEDQQEHISEEIGPGRVAHTVRAHGYTNETKVTEFDIEYANSGNIRMTATYLRPFPNGEWVTLCALSTGVFGSGELDPIAIGREIASAELTYLVQQTGSNAAALDYWQADQRESWYSQQDWADVRGVGRQTVNDRIRHTRQSLDEE